MASLSSDNALGPNFTLAHNETSNTNVTLNPYPNGLEGFIMWVIPVLIVLLNTVVFIVVPRIKTLQPGTRIGMLSLAASDFCMGTFLIVSHIYMAVFAHYHTDKTQPFCILVGMAITISFGTSMMALAFIAVDRLIKMALPLRYPRIMTTRNARIIIALIWITIIIPMLLNFRHESAIQTRYYKHVFLCLQTWVGDSTINLSFAFFTQVLPTFTCMASFIGIFCIATRRKMRPREDSSAQFKRDLRIFRTLAIMTLGFYIAIMPYFATFAVPELLYGHTLSPITDFVGCWLAASNSFWNAAIYMLTMKSFREALYNLITGRPSRPSIRL